MIEADYRWEDALRSDEEFRNRQSDIPDHVVDSLAGQNMLADLRISELLDTTAKLLDRAFRNPAAMAEEGAQLARERPASKDRVSADELTHRVSGFSRRIYGSRGCTGPSSRCHRHSSRGRRMPPAHCACSGAGLAKDPRCLLIQSADEN